MIDARELRIGNIVEPITMSPIMVTGITQQKTLDGIFTLIFVDYGESFLQEHLNPVELSEQWLIKFGFEQTNDVNKSLSKEASNHVMLLSSIGKKYVVEIRNVMMSGSIMLQFSVTCVHQLQNLHFALTGKELTIQP